MSEKTAARRFAEAYLKSTGQPVRVHVDQARDRVVIEEPYVHWLEDQLAQVLDAARAART